MSNRELPHGFELRRCTAGDVDAVADLHTRRSGPVDAADFRLVATDPCAGAGWTAAVFERATGRAVSSVMLLDETVRMVDVDLPAGQVELVVTDEAHEGRGFVRALMAWTTEESARRGHVVQPITGIPSFYRRFGYSYAIPIGSWRTLGTPPQPLDPAVTVREATLADIAALTALHKSEQRRADVSMPHSSASWQWIIMRSGDVSLVAERGDHVVAGARTLPPEEGHAVAELSAADEPAAISLLATIAAEQHDLVLLDRPWTAACRAVAPFLDDLAEPERDMKWYYVRIPDVPDLLNRIRPVLQRRLDHAANAELGDRLMISSYSSHVVADVANGVLGPFHVGGPLQAPISQGGSGIPIDVWPSLLFGPHGAVELERRLPDVLLGRQRSTMDVLFPPVSADLATFYIPF